MIAGAGSIFLVNIVLKATLSDFQYGEYSIFITFLQVCISFGFLGLEQVFLRLSEVRDKTLLTDKKLLKITFVVGLLFSLLLSAVFSKIFLQEQDLCPPKPVGFLQTVFKCDELASHF